MRFRELRELVEQLVAGGSGGGGTPDIFNRELISDLAVDTPRLPVNDDVPNQIQAVVSLADGDWASLYAIPADSGDFNDRVEIDYVSLSAAGDATLHIDSLPAGCYYAVRLNGTGAIGDINETPIR